MAPKYLDVLWYLNDPRLGAVAQLVEQWSRSPVTRVRNQVDAL